MLTETKPKDGQRYRSDCGRAATQYSDTFMGNPCVPYWDTRYPDPQGWHTIGASFKTRAQKAADYILGREKQASE